MMFLKNLTKTNNQRGVALILVTITFAILAVIMQIFVFNTKTDYESVKAQRDAVKARYLAVSVLELSKLFLKVQNKYLDSNPMISNMGLDMGQILKMLIPMFFDSEGMAGQLLGVDIDGMGLKKGQGTAILEKYESEEGKININCGISDTLSESEKILLTGLFADRRYDELFYRTLKSGDTMDRQKQVAAFLDYVDMDQSGILGGDEDAYYKTLKEPYLSKNNLLDSKSEINMIQGADPVFMANFGRSISIYGACKINLCGIDPNDWQLIAGIIVAAAKNLTDPVLLDPVRLKLLATTIAPQMPMICKDTTMFSQAVGNPGTGSMMIGSMLGTSIESTGDLGNDGVTDSEVSGVELDPTKLQKLVFSSSKRFYRIKAVGSVGKITHSIETVWDQMAVSTSSSRIGAYVYWREN